ncbi:41616_t:CDS:2 [Gigaspora margarita]|uniref:41616_t:CDS:1 n=1 Tax=Gigaspora margarita TaxID=4874 RepID=A0ABN7URU4_GIGMA|nr:41616_t:CDS:2 [Gigaspora margarita]
MLLRSCQVPTKDKSELYIVELQQCVVELELQILENDKFNRRTGMVKKNKNVSKEDILLKRSKYLLLGDYIITTDETISNIERSNIIHATPISKNTEDDNTVADGIEHDETED